MISNLAIPVGILAAIAAALAMVVAHHIARKRQWSFVTRYTYGVSVIGLAFAAPLFAALPAESAALLLLILAVIAGASGMATWLSYDTDAPSLEMSMEDRVKTILAEHDETA